MSSWWVFVGKLQSRCQPVGYYNNQSNSVKSSIPLCDQFHPVTKNNHWSVCTTRFFRGFHQLVVFLFFNFYLLIKYLLSQGSKWGELSWKCAISKLHATDWSESDITGLAMRAPHSRLLKPHPSILISIHTFETRQWKWLHTINRYTITWYAFPQLLCCSCHMMSWEFWAGLL